MQNDSVKYLNIKIIPTYFDRVIFSKFSSDICV